MHKCEICGKEYVVISGTKFCSFRCENEGKDI